ncbi:MAG: lyase family protein [Paracoccaceae bacterium]
MTRPTFSDAKVSEIFGDASFARRLLDVEAAYARAQANLGVIPSEAGVEIDRAARDLIIEPDELQTGVAAAGVPVPALVVALRRAVAEPHKDWVHFGATSQDIIDCALLLAIRDAMGVIEARLGAVIDGLETLSTTHAETVMAGRTRGQVATPITFGLRAAYWAQPCIALEDEVDELARKAFRVQSGGASGAQTAIAPHGPAIAVALAKELNLTSSAPWHTDRAPLRHIAFWASRLITALAKIASDTIISSRSEIGEVTAGATGGSSTMPQKANPVTAEAILSIAAVARSVDAGLAGAAVYSEERDGSMWAVEWHLLPQLMELTAAALAHSDMLVSTMQPNAQAMSERVRSNPEIMAEAAVFALAPKIGRVKAVELVKEALAKGEPLSSVMESSLAPDPLDAIAPSKAISAEIFATRGGSSVQ